MSVTKETIPGFLGLGKAVGSRKISNEMIAQMLGRRVEVVNRLGGRTGIENRNWVDEDQATSDLATEAIIMALEMAKTEPRSLKAIRVGTMSEDYHAVPVSAMVQERVGSPNLGNYHDVGAACVSFLHALYGTYTSLTSPLGEGGPQAVVGAEVISRSIDKSRPDTFLLFGDAASAVIMDNVPDSYGLFKYIAFQFGADGRHAKELYIPSGGSRSPSSHETIENKEHCIFMNGKLVKINAVSRMVECLHMVFEKVGLKPGDLAMLFPHQANLEIIEDVAKSLNFPMERIYVNIDRVGNTSAASIPLAMTDAYYEGKLLPDEMIGMCSFGAGMEFGAAVMPTVGLPPRAAVLITS